MGPWRMGTRRMAMSAGGTLREREVSRRSTRTSRIRCAREVLRSLSSTWIVDGVRAAIIPAGCRLAMLHGIEGEDGAFHDLRALYG